MLGVMHSGRMGHIHQTILQQTHHRDGLDRKSPTPLVVAPSLAGNWLPTATELLLPHGDKAHAGTHLKQ